MMPPISWPTDAQTWISAPITIPGLPATYPAKVQLGRAEHFHDGWLTSLDEPTMDQVLQDLSTGPGRTRRLRSVGWTLRQRHDNQIELIDADGTIEELDFVDGQWLLPRQCGNEVAAPLPPLAALYRSMALVEAYAYGPTDQHVEADELSEAVATISALLGQLAGITLGQTLDADNATVQQVLTDLAALLAIDLTAPAAAHAALTRLTGEQLRIRTDPQTTSAVRNATVAYLSGAARVLPQYLPPGAPDTATGTTSAAGALVRYDPAAARAWLAAGAADDHGIDDGFCAHDLTIVAGLEDLLLALSDGDAPDAWAPSADLQRVQIWRTADGDGIDGGGLITADVSTNSETIRIASRHQGFDQFTRDAATCGIEAAVEALGHVARLVNREGAVLFTLRGSVRPELG